jgi:para-nitrobenzyl esterase
MVTVNTSQKIDTIVQTTRGAVRGAWENGIAVFRGIPYAEPPVHKLRFKPPVPRQRWDGIRNATRFGEIVPQTDQSPIDAMGLPEGVTQGDDCLNLNVWTPEPGRASLPVLVWIHGGSFKYGTGSCPGYDGATFAREGIVTVTLNYRLGVAGFLYIGDRPGSGNFGLLDQIAALEWVQENIAAFGGDPSRVTVAGESAGGFSIGQLLVAPAARGLFNRAIVQSGGTQLHIKAEAASIIGAEVLRRLGVNPRDDDAFAAITSAQLLAAQRAVEPVASTLLAKSPVILDLLPRLFVVFVPSYGTDVLPERALLPIGRGAARDVDLMVGWNADETMAFYPTREAQQGMVKLIEGVADFAFSPTEHSGAEVLERYRIGRSGANLADTVVPFVTDMLFGIPSIRLAETAQPHNQHTYMYRFAWKGSLGAAHGLEIPFMFDSLEKAQNVVTALGAPNPPQVLAKTMHGAWVNFIKTGSPQHPNLPKWPAYDPIRRATMDLDVESRVVDDPNGDERRLWDRVHY